MVARIFVCLIALAVFAAHPDTAEAAKKGKKKKGSPGQIVAEEQLFDAVITYKKGKKNRQESIKCLDTVPGTVKLTPNGLRFTPFSATIKKLKRKNSPKLPMFKAKQKAGKQSCVKPPESNLDRYNGQFTRREAHILYNRFAFGATPAEIDAAVAAGLEATVNRLTTFVADAGENALQAAVYELECDEQFSRDPFTGEVNENYEACDPTDPNDFSVEGLRLGWYWRLINTKNRFHEKVAFFLHDERASNNINGLGGDLRYAGRNYYGLLRQTAINGDYKAFVDKNTREFGVRESLSMSYLDNGSNHCQGNMPTNVNENWGREIMELQTIGATGILGVPNYGDFDIAMAALALSGYDFDYNNDRWESAFKDGRHCYGPKPLFSGTPHAVVVDMPGDLINALLADPRTWEHLAEDMWHQFVGPSPTPAALRELAKVLRDNNGNLLPAFRKIMMSKAVLSNANERALIKHPIDLVVGFVKNTGIKLTPSEVRSALRDLGQEPLAPNTVFGWDERKLADEFRQLMWRNRVTSWVQWDLEERGYDYFSQFVEAFAGAPFPSQGVRDRIAAYLGLELTAGQKAAIERYMNYNLVSCTPGTPNCVNGKRLNLDVFTAVHEDLGGNNEGETRGAIAMMAQLPEYRMK